MEREVLHTYTIEEYTEGAAIIAWACRQLGINELKRWQNRYLIDIFTAVHYNVKNGILKTHRVGCQGANGIGKTHANVIIILCMFLYANKYLPDTQFFSTIFSTKEEQTFDSFFRYLRHLIHANNLHHLLFVSPAQGLVYLRSNPNIMLRVGSFSQGQATSVKGHHAEKGFVVVFGDECNGIKADLMKQLETLFTSCFGLFVATGNPESYPGYFKDNMTSLSPTWDRYIVGRPDLFAGEGETPESPYDDFANDDYSNYTRAKYGEESQEYQCTVLGKTYGLEDTGRVIPEYYIYDAYTRTPPNLDGPYTMAIDIAEGADANSDYSVIWVENRYAPVAIFRKRIRYDRFCEIVLREWIPKTQPLYIVVDANAYGLGLGVQISELYNNKIFGKNDGARTRVIQFKGQRQAYLNLLYANLRTEAYMSLREKIKNYYCLDKEMSGIKEFVDELQYIKGRPNTSDVYALEPKNKLARSPDIADCAAMASIVSLAPLASTKKI